MTCTGPGITYTATTDRNTGVTQVTFTSTDLDSPMVVSINPDNSWSTRLPNGTLISGQDPGVLSSQAPPLAFDLTRAGFMPSHDGFADWAHLSADCSCLGTRTHQVCNKVLEPVSFFLGGCALVCDICGNYFPHKGVAAGCKLCKYACASLLFVVRYVCYTVKDCAVILMPQDPCHPMCLGPSSDYDFCDSDYPN
jgi:hypothetical protein